jgi:predicted nucleotidyltransferase component of viral defense system
MIPQSYIIEWRAQAPWVSDAQVEQDLLISRSLVAIFSNPLLAANLAFRGGTALRKLYLQPPTRYSEDIDLVQTSASPTRPLIKAIREALDPFLGKPTRRPWLGRVILIYTAPCEVPPVKEMKLKVEVNTREQFSVFSFRKHPYVVNSRWFSDTAEILTYQLEELLGTKMRALYQRERGRDLYDIWRGLTVGKANPRKVVRAFSEYMVRFEGRSISQQDYRSNLKSKLKIRRFTSDLTGLLRGGEEFDVQGAFNFVDRELLALL